MIFNTTIVPESVSILDPDGSGSRLCYQNILEESDLLITTTGGNDGDLGFLVDYLTTTYYETTSGSTFYVEFDAGGFLSAEEFDYFAIKGVNFAEAGVTAINIYANDEVNQGSVSLIESIDVVGKPDGSSIILFTDSILDASIVRFEFVCTGNASISLIYAGKSIQMPGYPDVGFSPARWNSDDEYTNFRTETNAFGKTNVEQRGSTETASFSFIPIEFMNSEWYNFIQNWDGQPVFFAWNPKDYKDDLIFGNIDFQRSSFTNSLHSTISFSVQGDI